MTPCYGYMNDIPVVDVLLKVKVLQGTKFEEDRYYLIILYYRYWIFEIFVFTLLLLVKIVICMPINLSKGNSYAKSHNSFHAKKRDGISHSKSAQNGYLSHSV